MKKYGMCHDKGKKNETETKTKKKEPNELYGNKK